MNIGHLLTWVVLAVLFLAFQQAFIFNRSPFGSQGSVSHLPHGLPGGSFTGMLKDAVECLAGPGLDHPVTSRCCCSPAAEQVTDLLPPSCALEETCACVWCPALPDGCKLQHSGAEASNAQAAFDELEERVSSLARAQEMHRLLAPSGTYFWSAPWRRQPRTEASAALLLANTRVDLCSWEDVKPVRVQPT